MSRVRKQAEQATEIGSEPGLGALPVSTASRHRWVVVLAVVVMALNLRGAATIFSPISQDVAAWLDLSDLTVGLVGTMPQLLFAASGLIVPWLIARVSVEQAAVLAMLITAAGQFARPFLGGAVGFLAFSALVFVGIGIGNMVLPPLVKRYFPDRIGAMTGLYSALIPTSAAVPPLFIVGLSRATGWQVSLASWGLPALLAAALWAWVWWRQMGAIGRLQSRNRTERGDLASAATAPPGAVAGLPLWRSRVAWGIVGIMAAQSLIAYAMFAWLPTLLLDSGFDASAASLMLSLFSGLGLVVGLVAAPLAANLRRPYILVLVSTVVFLLGLGGLIAAPPALLPGCVVLLALGPITFNMALVLVNTRSRTDRGSAALSSFMQGFGYLFASVGPFTFGLLHAATSGWAVPLVFLIAVALTQPLFGWWATRPRFVEDEAGGPAHRADRCEHSSPRVE